MIWRRGSIPEMDADRTQDLITKAKREGFDSGAAWMLAGACWAFILGFGVWAIIGELDNVDTGIWKGPIVVAIMALAVLLWWLPMREARRRARP